jgi:hypothetical protein
VRDILDWGPFYMRFLTQFVITFEDGLREEALGISEYLDPAGLRKRYLRPLVKLRLRTERP